ncbi:MAG: cytidylate kinase-like family protein [Oscillospiraceae bacterium]|nr:cytidylate kinase-like family protein [Oscillospiraceae bacterium]
MEKYVITISRQFGSLGRTIAQNMSLELGIEYYDRDIVEATARRMGLPTSEISQEEERSGGFFAERKYPLGMGLVSMQQEIFQIQSNIIRDLAKKESCIIVGRCADSILRDMDRVLNVYIYAPVEERIRNCTKILGMDEKEARRMLRDVDRAREIYRLKYCEGAREVFDHRDLMIDSSRFGPEGTAQLLCGVARQLFSWS